MGCNFGRSVTPESEFVVAPAGYSLQANTTPLAFASAMSSGVVWSVRYNVMSGVKAPLYAGSNADRMRWRYSTAILVLVTGGFKFGMAMTRSNCFAAAFTVRGSIAPSRKWKWKSSGRAIVNEDAKEDMVILEIQDGSKENECLFLWVSDWSGKKMMSTVMPE